MQDETFNKIKIKTKRTIQPLPYMEKPLVPPHEKCTFRHS